MAVDLQDRRADPIGPHMQSSARGACPGAGRSLCPLPRPTAAALRRIAEIGGELHVTPAGLDVAHGAERHAVCLRDLHEPPRVNVDGSNFVGLEPPYEPRKLLLKMLNRVHVNLENSSRYLGRITRACPDLRRAFCRTREIARTTTKPEGFSSRHPTRVRFPGGRQSLIRRTVRPTGFPLSH